MQTKGVSNLMSIRQIAIHNSSVGAIARVIVITNLVLMLLLVIEHG